MANKLQSYFDLIIATQDWHPEDHISFATNHPNKVVGDVIQVDHLPQVLWPDHCIQYSKGAQFHPKFDTHKIHKIFHKGIDKNIDSYSAFFDNAKKRSTGLSAYLKVQGVTEIYIVGLATDYCVKFSALDAIELGFRTTVFQDAMEGVNLQPYDSKQAIDIMRQAGARILESKNME